MKNNEIKHPMFVEGQTIYYVHPEYGMFEGKITGFYVDGSGYGVYTCAYAEDWRMPTLLLASTYGKSWFIDVDEAKTQYKKLCPRAVSTNASNDAPKKCVDADMIALVGELVELSDENLAQRVIDSNDVQNALLAFWRYLNGQ